MVRVYSATSTPRSVVSSVRPPPGSPAARADRRAAGRASWRPRRRSAIRSAHPLPPALHLAYPWLYVVLAPLFSLWDGVSMLSMSRLRGLPDRAARAVRRLARRPRAVAPAGLERRAAAARRRSGGSSSCWPARWPAWPLFVGGGPALAPAHGRAGRRPSRATVVFDVHSHTNVSHDVRGTLMRGFDTEANLRWHRRAGFDAVFVTDHNTVAASAARRARRRSVPASRSAPGGRTSSCWATRLPVDQRRYNGSLDALRAPAAARATRAYGALSVLSLPEYERNHWAGSTRWSRRARTGSRS